MKKVALLLLVLAAAIPAGATVYEWRFISQPLYLDELKIVQTPYQYRVWAYPHQVSLTVAENLLSEHGTGWTDQNAASRCGIVVRLHDDDPEYAEGVHFHGYGVDGDTIRVVMDLSEARSPEDWRGEILTETVDLTVECIRRNARTYIGANWVDLRVVGNPDFGDRSGLISLAPELAAPERVTGPEEAMAAE